MIQHRLTPSTLLCQPAPCGQVSVHPTHPTSHVSRPAHHGHHLPQQQKLPAWLRGALGTPGTAHPMAVLPQLSVPLDWAQGCSPMMETLTQSCLAPGAALPCCPPLPPASPVLAVPWGPGRLQRPTRVGLAAPAGAGLTPGRFLGWLQSPERSGHEALPCCSFCLCTDSESAFQSSVISYFPTMACISSLL